MEKPLGDGLERVALDLHVHTPASHDWAGGVISPEELVEAAITAGLSGIALTDHQSGDWIDVVKEAAHGKDLTIFPGVELNNLLGNAGIHLVALFPLDTTSLDVERFLSAVGAVTGTGTNVKRTAATRSILDILREIDDRKGIGVLAHCRSSKGVLNDLRGEIRSTIIRHRVILAAEAHAEEYYDEEKGRKRKRTFDILDGTDSEYKRELAVFQASDNPSPAGTGHSLVGIGARFTYFFVERPLTLESLRQCFIDRTARIVYPELGEKPTKGGLSPSAPRVIHLSVSGGFLENLDLALHAGLTTILGAKGSGKSVLVELLRFGLGQPPTQPEVLQDHETKLLKRLEVYGSVTITVRDSTGTLHVIKREYNPAEGHPYEDLEFDPSQFFRCHFLSQGEIIRLAERESEQLKFIDSFFDFYLYQRDIERARQELVELDRRVAAQMRARKRLVDLTRSKATLEVQIAEKDKALTTPIFAKFQAAQEKAQYLDRASAHLDRLKRVLEETRRALEDVPALSAPTGNVADDPLARRVKQLATESSEDLGKAVVTLMDGIDAADREIAKERGNWLPEYTEVAATYKDEIEKLGGDAIALSQERARLVNAVAETDKALQEEGHRSSQLSPTMAQRNQTLERMQTRLREYTEERQRRCKWFEDKSDGKIRASVKGSSNYSDYCDRLSALKKGSYLTGSEIEAIASKTTPSEFVGALLRYELTQKEGDLDPLATQTGLGRDRIKQLAGFLLAEEEYERLLDLEYTAGPTDRPEIFFRRDDGDYAPLDELSTGQKCTAFLVMALCEGDIPIIIDQPEDSLDIKSIWDDMCVRLRGSKRDRQFLFTTHNSSLAVASDTDKFVVLKGDSQRGEVVMSGAIDSTPVRDEVLNLLEGGEGTYFLKQRKYNVWDRSHD